MSYWLSEVQAESARHIMMYRMDKKKDPSPDLPIGGGGLKVISVDDLQKLSISFPPPMGRAGEGFWGRYFSLLLIHRIYLLLVVLKQYAALNFKSIREFAFLY